MSTNNSDMQRIQAAVTTALHAHWRLFLAEGIILLVLGVVAVVLPPIATIATEIIIGWLLLVSGIVGLITTLWMRLAPGFLWSLLSAVVGIAAGIVLLTVFLVIEGIASILFALEHRREQSRRWGLMLVSGIVDLILAGMIFLGLPGTAAWAIGLLVGINLVFGGAALIAMALHARATA
jgi:uncharacterized membrane protein HdeD (DUF308 family)